MHRILLYSPFWPTLVCIIFDSGGPNGYNFVALIYISTMIGIFLNDIGIFLNEIAQCLTRAFTLALGFRVFCPSSWGWCGGAEIFTPWCLGGRKEGIGRDWGQDI